VPVVTSVLMDSMAFLIAKPVNATLKVLRTTYVMTMDNANARLKVMTTMSMPILQELNVTNVLQVLQ